MKNRDKKVTEKEKERKQAKKWFNATRGQLHKMLIVLES